MTIKNCGENKRVDIWWGMLYPVGALSSEANEIDAYHLDS